MSKLVDRILFRLRFRSGVVECFRVIAWRLAGMKIGKNVSLHRVKVTWPHKVCIGSLCLVEDGVEFKHDGIWSDGHSIVVDSCVFIGRNSEFNIRQKINIGSNCLIASGCKFIDHDHGYVDLSTPMNKQDGAEAPIHLEEDVWLGVNVVVLKGVTIGKGAIVAAGAVVTKSIPPYEIWGGIPAKKISTRLPVG